MKVEGVVEAHADMTRHEVTVTLAGPDVPLAGVIQALGDAGFTARERSEGKGEKP